LSVIVGLQLLLWTSSGLIFSWNAIEVVRGEAFLSDAGGPSIEAPTETVAPFAVMGSLSGVSEVRLAWCRDRWAWIYQDEEGRALAVADASDGQRLAALTEEAARSTARLRFTEAGDIVGAELVHEATGELRGRDVPVWRVTFDDERNSRIYVDALTGEIAAVRNDTWRLFDFFWMLHIMDYDERTDFNHWLLKLASVLGVATSLSGLMLAVIVFRPRSS
jgi:hypothetical protein